ncbi:MAG: serine/threonine-protein kinase [Bdellovibrionota bacterium]
MSQSKFSVEKFGKYLLIEQAASGGMAVIYKAAAKMSDASIQTFAIKRILPQYSTDQEFISLLHDEAKLMVRLNHPNIVSMVEFGKHNEQFYIAMEYIDGITLKDLITKVASHHEPFTIDMASHIIREIAIGLSYAHRRKDENGKSLAIVHRDVSPANILLSFQGDVKVADFGISKAQSQSHKTQVGIIRGKIGYMSPEQTRSDIDIDHRSDLYSLGIIFYEMLTGLRPFASNTIPEAIKLVREGKLVKPSEVRQDIPKNLEAIMLKILAHDREERYQHAQDIVDDLNEFLVQHAPLGRPVRISHVDLMGFIQRFYKKEMAKASSVGIKEQEFEKIVEKSILEEQAKSRKMYHEPSQTFAANPMFELSVPETTVRDKNEYQKQQDELMRKRGYVRLREGRTGSISVPIVEYESTHTETKRMLPSKLILALPFLIIFAAAGYYFIRNPSSSPPPEPMKVVKNPLRKIMFYTDPPGAEVMLNGQVTGVVTPGFLNLDFSSPVQVEFELAGHLPIKKVLTQETYKEEMRFVLDPKHVVSTLAKVSLSSDPTGASIKLNGVDVEKTTPSSLDLEVGGQYQLTFNKEGYEEKTTSIDVQSPEEIQKKVFLNKIKVKPKPVKKAQKQIITSTLGNQQNALKTGVFSMITVPWSYVYINGKMIQETPLTKFKIQEGQHTVRLSNKGQKVEDHTMQITVKANKTTICSYNFVSKQDKCRIE